MEGSEEERLERLLRWAGEHGISDSPKTPNPQHQHVSCLGYSLSVAHFPDAGGRGIGAVRDLRRGELVLTVPKSILLTTDNALKHDQTLALALQNHSSLNPTQILTVGLLYEVGKGRRSKWYPYLLNLPHSYDILATFSEFEKQALQVDDAIWTAEKSVTDAKRDWTAADLLMKELKLKPRLSTLNAWIWAAATIASRTLHIPWDEAGCLCPVGDLFNYATPGEESNKWGGEEDWMHALSLQDYCMSKQDTNDNLVGEQCDAPLRGLTDGGFDEDIAAYCFYARQNYKSGDQVLLCYGTYTNLELLQHYGFLLHENPGEKVFLPLEPSMYSLNSWPKESLYIYKDGKPSFALLSTLRLWATPSSQRKTVSHLAYSGRQLSEQSEMFVLKWLSKSCCAILNSLPTTIEQDRLLLSTIDKIQCLNESVEPLKELSGLGAEVCSILEANSGEVDHTPMSYKMKRSVERLKLAIQWRLLYKKILAESMSWCTEIVSCLSSQCKEEK